jgi:hypothetical protein
MKIEYNFLLGHPCKVSLHQPVRVVGTIAVARHMRRIPHRVTFNALGHRRDSQEVGWCGRVGLRVDRAQTVGGKLELPAVDYGSHESKQICKDKKYSQSDSGVVASSMYGRTS